MPYAGAMGTKEGGIRTRVLAAAGAVAAAAAAEAAAAAAATVELGGMGCWRSTSGSWRRPRC